jgi:VIT1/CCC1 family predicted Fe2+/Mn2+ transporter
MGIISGIVFETIFFGSPSRWIGHAVIATAGLVLLVLVIVTGVIRSGRIPSLRFRQVHLLHKIASVSFTGLPSELFLSFCSS